MDATRKSESVYQETQKACTSSSSINRIIDELPKCPPQFPTKKWPSVTVQPLFESQALNKGALRGRSSAYSKSRRQTQCETELDMSQESEGGQAVDLDEPKDLAKMISTTDCFSLQREDSNGNAHSYQRTRKFAEEQVPSQRKKSLLEDLKFGRNSPKRSQTIFSEESDDDVVLGKRSIPNLSLFAEQHGGKLMKIKRAKEIVRVSFTCKMNHRFSLPESQLDSWCKICETVLKNAHNYAKSKGGRCLSTEITKELEFECEAGHRWSVCYRKSMRSWCRVCRKRRKQLVKEALEEENKRIEEKRRFKQAKLLEEARINMIKEQKKAKTQKTEYVNTFKIVEEEITKIVSRHAREFIEKQEDSEYIQILELYKVLTIPESCLTKYFEALTRVELKKKLRHYTILLHPDKNCHPQAKVAFQKIFGIFEVVMKGKDNSNFFSSFD